MTDKAQQQQREHNEQPDCNKTYLVSGVLIDRMMTNVDNYALVAELTSRPHIPAPTMKEIVILLEKLCVTSNCWGDKNTENCPFNARGQIHCELTKIKNLLESELEIIKDKKRAEAAYHQGLEAGKAEAARTATIAVLKKLKTDLETRFVSSSNQWARGRNSGLIECCNIIDDYLQQQEQQGGGQ
jgi:hypothetical protein